MIIGEGLITEVIDIAAATTESEDTVRRAGHSQCAQRSRCKGLRSKIARRSHCVARARLAQHRASAALQRCMRAGCSRGGEASRAYQKAASSSENSAKGATGAFTCHI